VQQPNSGLQKEKLVRCRHSPDDGTGVYRNGSIEILPSPPPSHEIDEGDSDDDDLDKHRGYS